ncbi:hypothetical protein ADIWIN_3541 [Winogradskyella psychrotolerans RS-3]|uniref:DUF192 domain-containing protein n=1 Tax=Winogradskyella psychrotolerans RS-3 TaxID=641526 RepID=S7WUP2_9FLAO|nr:DUF192 domain-containing protein [Winogradskyella psychrotolerans]EPR70469.1 hypothetical protein ADIWIN_3541 [Winogradskyella psychrotolerans RS-3]
MHIQVFIKSGLIVLGLALLSSCKEDKKTIIADKVVVNFKKEGTLSLKKADSDSLIKTIDIEISDDEYATQTGLMYRTTLEANQGMLFIFPDVEMRSFYMKNTKIPLDIIYIDEDKTIVSFQKNAKPMDETSLPSEAPAKYVLEVYGGLSDVWQLAVGDKISFTQTDD